MCFTTMNLKTIQQRIYFTAPGLAWNAAFKKKGITFDHLVDSDMLFIIEN